MKTFLKILFCSCFMLNINCELPQKSASETVDSYEIKAGATIVAILKTPLSSNLNERGDLFTTHLKEPFLLDGKTILSQGAEINGLVKRTKKFEKLGDRASLFLLFDQLVLADGRKIPLSASLDTDNKEKVIKLMDKEKKKNMKIIGGSALIGAVAGGLLGEKDGAGKGILIGAAAGAGAVMLSRMMEIKLPEGTELILKLDEKLIIPKIQ